MILGQIVTCYSYKGGVGRSFALANLAAILAEWRYRVLCVDWDLEAPGLWYYFSAERNSPGLLEMVEAVASGTAVSGLEHVQTIHVKPDVTVDLIVAGSSDASYAGRVQSLDWEHLYSQNQFGHILEQWRSEWMRRYDIVLVDSRTGITDIGGICTAQLPDVLLVFFTANQQSVDGVLQVVDQAISTRNRLVFDRPRLLTVPSRFDQGVEYERSERWRRVFEDRFAHYYRDWADQGISHDVIIGHTTIPYSPYWSFGEELPVLSESQREPSYISYRFATLAALLGHRLENTELMLSSRDSYVDSAMRAGHRRRGFVYDVYISSTPETIGQAHRLDQLLTQAGFSVTTGEQVASDRWTDNLQRLLNDSQNMILMVGEKPDKLQEREAQYVLRQVLDDYSARRVIPVITSPAAARSMPPILANIKWYDLSSGSVEAAAREISSVLADSPIESA
jgi:MinD-like ATPase involved in chromosome partitioning or flagellar assembly